MLPEPQRPPPSAPTRHLPLGELAVFHRYHSQPLPRPTSVRLELRTVTRMSVRLAVPVASGRKMLRLVGSPLATPLLLLLTILASITQALVRASLKARPRAPPWRGRPGG